ncbi:MAG: hypothetical protein K0R63_983 [Rickettsiales bacterium]|jgi:hypothetical protein|nr:hypothetical protein [Rickettsiales bacterium]
MAISLGNLWDKMKSFAKDVSDSLGLKKDDPIAAARQKQYIESFNGRPAAFFETRESAQMRREALEKQEPAKPTRPVPVFSGTKVEQSTSKPLPTPVEREKEAITKPTRPAPMLAKKVEAETVLEREAKKSAPKALPKITEAMKEARVLKQAGASHHKDALGITPPQTDGKAGPAQSRER